MAMSRERECRCLELEERFKELESEMKKGKKEFESLELRFKELESEKLVMEEDFRNVEESEIEQMMVNKALEVEKVVAEKEAEEWKRKFEKLVVAVRKLEEVVALRGLELGLDENVKVGLEVARIKFPERSLGRSASGSPYITTPVKDCILGGSRGNVSSRRQVNKMLSFEDDGQKSADVVDLWDSETEEKSEKKSDILEERSIGENYEDEDVEACQVNTSTPPRRKRKRVITSDSENDDDDDDDDLEACEVNTSTPPKRKQVITGDSENDDDDLEACEVNTSKRKRVITSDSENDDDEDDIPISKLKNLKPPNQEMSDLVDKPTTGQRRVSSRLRKQRVLEECSTSSERKSTERLVGIPTTGKAGDDETEEEEGSEGESESESLDGFIVDDDDDNDNDETAIKKSDETGEEESDGETSYADVMSRLRRDKRSEKQQNWKYEADMLSDFGKDPVLCMRAVCVLYRFQTEDEKATRSSRVSNGRGFNMADAERGTRIGQCLTDRDPEGDLKKSVEELQNFEFKAVEICRDLAGKYSKQLFNIYTNREDPFFTAPPSR